MSAAPRTSRANWFSNAPRRNPCFHQMPFGGHCGRFGRYRGGTVGCRGPSTPDLGCGGSDGHRCCRYRGWPNHRGIRIGLHVGRLDYRSSGRRGRRWANNWRSGGELRLRGRDLARAGMPNVMHEYVFRDGPHRAAVTEVGSVGGRRRGDGHGDRRSDTREKLGCRKSREMHDHCPSVWSSQPCL